MDVRAIQEAVINGQLERVRLLLDKGTPTNTRYYDGDYALLDIAAIRYNTEIMKLLIERGADLNAASRTGLTVLHHAAKKINTPAVKLLLDSGMDVNIADNNGYTPLHYAARDSEVDTVALLLEHGADTYAKTTDFGEIPLHCVYNMNSGDRTAIAALLLAVSPESANVLNNEGVSGFTRLTNLVGLQDAVVAAVPRAVGILAARRRLPATVAWQRRVDELQARYAAFKAAASSGSGAASASGAGAGAGSGAGSGSAGNSSIPAIITINKTPSQRAYEAAIRRRNSSKVKSGNARRNKTRSRK